MTDDILKLAVYAKGGDKEAYGKLYEHYSNDMYRFALSICKNKSDAEDAVQETYVRYLLKKPKLKAEDAVQEAALSVFKSIHCLYDPTKFKAYLFTALSNACKKTFCEITAQLPETLAYETENFISADVKNALDLLDTSSREIVLLSAIGGFKSGEIAKILDIPSVTVRTKKRRALMRMRKELE